MNINRLHISIPYGAIKSFSTCKPRTMSFLFQFLMVRLKDNLYCIVLIRSRIFQFLMVRLKADSVVAVYHICLISIPYGAIKRPTKKAILEIGSAFQFLMVRLKDATSGAFNMLLKNFNSLWCD